MAPAKTTLLVLIAMITATPAATAAVTNFYPQQAFPGLPGHNTYDLQIGFSGQLGVQQLYVRLVEGSIYNNTPFGSALPPSSALLAIVPELQFDTFVATGGLTSTTSAPTLILGGGTNAGGGAALDMTSTDRLSAAWSPAVGTTVTNQNDYTIARLTLSDDARGELLYFGTTTDNATYQRRLLFQSGSIFTLVDPWSGDFNFDLKVDNTDLNLLLANWGADNVPGAWLHNFVGPIVDNKELNSLLASWGGVGFYSPFAIPEPGSALLCGVAAGSLLTRRRRVRTRATGTSSAPASTTPAAPVAVLLGSTASAPAQVTALHVVPVAVPTFNDPLFDLSASFTIDLEIDFTGALGGQQIYVSLTQGELLYHPLGTGTPPD
ncbi:hypothetical protein [Botrimarina hoheduenensis]|uniref:PEP-CTERM protein-sorting domain-containing protein n=1 Tax=Botrimarina hoheduenensis TaxID=2528000 RepID=A0A5C5W7P0_9BACT|nr:hypothetical protein [Botrimarina hoheduenensis]TWT46604.1 hypothetical protein Pla111_17000 [Botrimarina hoheduenensis]